MQLLEDFPDLDVARLVVGADVLPRPRGMDQPEVDRPQIEISRRGLECLSRTLGVFDLGWELGRDVDLLAWHIGVTDGPTYALFVAVGQSRVDVAVADPEGFGH